MLPLRYTLRNVAVRQSSALLSMLGIALTQIAQIAIAGDDAGAAVRAASEALDLQDRIGYTEGMVSAMHVLGTAQRLSDDLDAARRHHRRALGLASRIGHAAAMCEAIEDLARDEVAERLSHSPSPSGGRGLFPPARRAAPSAPCRARSRRPGPSRRRP